jgi:PAS domain S-box-containing protein
MLSESRFDDQLRRIGLLADNQTSFLNIEIKDPGVNLVKGQHPEINRSQQPLTRMASRAIQLKRDMEKAGQTFGRSKIEIDTNGYRDYRGVPVYGAWLWNAELGLGLATETDLKDAMAPYYQVRSTVVGVLGFTLLASVGAVLLVLILGERTSRALMKARDNLEAKVGERTAELQDKQTQLEAAVERSRLILDSAGEGIFGVNPKGEAAFINPAANRMLGYESDELIGRNVHEVIHHSYADGSVYPMEKCPMYLSYADGTDHHVTNEVLWRKDGTAFPVEYTSMPIRKDGRVVGAVITFMDIAERMLAEEAVRRNQEQLQIVLESIQAVAFLKDRQGRHLLVNRFYENAVGVKKEDIIGKTDLEVFPPKAARQIMALDEQVMSSGTMQTLEEEIPHPDGRLHAYLTTKVPLFDKDGIVYGMCGLATDITDRKRMEQALTLEHERLQKILDTSPVGVGISTGGVVRFANPRFAELFYSRKGEAALDAYVDPKDREYIVDQLKRSGIVRDYELQTYGPNREIRDTLGTFIRTEYEGQSGILAWMVDLSSLKEAEKELRARFDELARFRRLAIGREQKMIELKKEINELLITKGLSEKYRIH